MKKYRYSDKFIDRVLKSYNPVRTRSNCFYWKSEEKFVDVFRVSCNPKKAHEKSGKIVARIMYEKDNEIRLF